MVKTLVATTFLLIALPFATIAFFEGRKAYWDWRVEQMCEKDGGVTIIERVALTPEQARLMPRGNGHISVVLKRAASPKEPVFAEKEADRYIRDHNPAVWLSKTNIIRRVDEKVVATIVRYTRRGGDMPSPAHESYFICPSIYQEDANLAQLFLIKGNAK